MIRNANISDLNSIYSIYKDRNDTEEHKNCNYTLSDWSWYIRNGIVYVYELNNELYGFIFGYDMGLWGYIEHIVIDKKHRGLNIGEKLVDYFIQNKFENWQQVELCHEMDLDDYFQKIGFESNQIITKWVHKLV
jgi:ribosomal protein S18 acetylase RimI-like enzyme